MTEHEPLLQDEIKVLTKATMQSESLLDKWGLPWQIWYCCSYWNHSRSQRSSVHLMLENFAFDSTQPVRWDGETMVVSNTHHHKERLKEYAISQGKECKYKTIDPAFAKMVRGHLRENELLCNRFGELCLKADRLQKAHARKFKPARTVHPDQESYDVMPF